MSGRWRRPDISAEIRIARQLGLSGGILHQDLVKFILDNIPGSRVVETRAVQAPSVSKARRKSLDFLNDDFDRKTKEKEVCPYGLPPLSRE